MRKIERKKIRWGGELQLIESDSKQNGNFILQRIARLWKRDLPTWYCCNCGCAHYGDTKDCHKCGYYRRKEQFVR